MFNSFFYIRIFNAYVLSIIRLHASLKFERALLLKLNVVQGVLSYRSVNLVNIFK